MIVDAVAFSEPLMGCLYANLRIRPKPSVLQALKVSLVAAQELGAVQDESGVALKASRVSLERARSGQVVAAGPALLAQELSVRVDRE